MTHHDPDDLTTVDGIIRSLYDSISGPADEKRDLRRFRSLFAPEARLIRTAAGDGRSTQMAVMDVDEYFRAACEYFKQAGFFEREVARRTDSFSYVTHVFSTYESRHAADDEEPFARGINSIQLFHDGARYWVVTIFWGSETPENPIPEDYLR